MIASTTKYTLKSIPAFLMFAILSLKSIVQANRSNGLIAIKIRLQDLRTLTVWETIEDLKAFRNSGVHLQAMIDSSKMGTNQFSSWETDRIPTWKEAIAKLNTKISIER